MSKKIGITGGSGLLGKILIKIIKIKKLNFPFLKRILGTLKKLKDG